MTVVRMLMGLVPILWSEGSGADVMKRIAAPMIGGRVTSFALELLVYPAIYKIWKRHFGLKQELARLVPGATLSGSPGGATAMSARNQRVIIREKATTKNRPIRGSCWR